MKKLIGAMVLGVIVVIYMVVQVNREQPANKLDSPNASAVGDVQWGESQPTEMRPQSTVRAFESYQVDTSNEENVEVYRPGDENTYVPPQPGSLAEVEALRDSRGRNVVVLALVPYQLAYEPVDYQWFREMEQGLYDIAYRVLESEGTRMVNLECATSVCVAEFDVPPGEEFSSRSFMYASEEIDTFDREKLSMVFLDSGKEENYRIIFQRKE